jgi:hypothetical protein
MGSGHPAHLGHAGMHHHPCCTGIELAAGALTLANSGVAESQESEYNDGADPLVLTSKANCPVYPGRMTLVDPLPVDQ